MIDDAMDLIDELSDEAAEKIMAELQERGFLDKTTPRYDDDLHAAIAAIVGTVLDENLSLVDDEEEDED